MNLFGWKARREAARPVLARGWSARGDAPLPQSWPERVRAAYEENPVAQRACRLVAEAVGSAPLIAGPRVGALLAARSGGQALLETCAAQLMLHGNAASRWNRALLDNAARPSGALVYDPGDAGATLTPAQFERLRDEMEAQFQGAANAGRPLLLEGGLSWQAMSMTPAEMDFIRLKEGAAREIAMVFGVPPMLVGLPGDATYANYREAMKALWRQTVLPLADTLLAGIAQALASWGIDERLAVDLDRVPALAEDRERLWARVSAADFLTPDEKRAMLGIAAGGDTQ